MKTPSREEEGLKEEEEAVRGQWSQEVAFGITRFKCCTEEYRTRTAPVRVGENTAPGRRGIPSWPVCSPPFPSCRSEQAANECLVALPVPASGGLASGKLFCFLDLSS